MLMFKSILELFKAGDSVRVRVACGSSMFLLELLERGKGKRGKRKRWKEVGIELNPEPYLNLGNCVPSLIPVALRWNCKLRGREGSQDVFLLRRNLHKVYLLVRVAVALRSPFFRTAVGLHCCWLPALRERGGFWNLLASPRQPALWIALPLPVRLGFRILVGGGVNPEMYF